MSKLVPAKCPSCGASIVVDPDKDVQTCEFCDNAFIVSKAITNYNTYNVEDNRTTTNIYKKKIDNEYSAEVEKYKAQRSENRMLGFFGVVFIILCIIAFLMMTSV